MYEWSTEKADSNFHKHGIDFEDAVSIFEGVVVETPSSRPNEDRFISVGQVDGVVLAVVWTKRGAQGEIRRIISARRARRSERDAYLESLARRASEGTDGLD